MEKEHFEILLEDIRGKFELVLEGQDQLRKAVKQEIQDVREELNEKFNMTAFLIERLDQKLEDKTAALDQKSKTRLRRSSKNSMTKLQALDRKIDDTARILGRKIDNVAAALDAHRADTEVHSGYTVYERSKEE